MRHTLLLCLLVIFGIIIIFCDIIDINIFRCFCLFLRQFHSYALCFDNNIELKTLALEPGEAIPQDAAAVMLDCPTAPVGQDICAALMDYLKSGGDLLLLTNYTADFTGLDEIVGYYGMARKTGVQLYDELPAYRALRAELERDMTPMPGARAVLEALSQRGVTHDVVTHRGASTRAVLARTGLWGFFRAILTAEDGFPRKPDPAAIVHLMQVYRLDPARTFYVGDRSLDLDCADRAGIGSILFHPADNPTPVPADRLVVTSLPELLTLPELSL